MTFYIDADAKKNISLAPMAGVTNFAFRMLCENMGATLTCTEMVSAKALCYGDKKTAELLYRHPGEKNVAAQIFGSDKDFMARGAKIVDEMGIFSAIDINMGCPTPKIVKNGDGSALMRDINKAAEIVCAVKRAVSVPVTVKMRRGWDESEITAPHLARLAEEAGADLITIHGRTREKMYSPHAEYATAREIKKSVKIPVIVNGDIDSKEKMDEVLSYTGCDGAMIGRAALGNPFIFARLSGQKGEAEASAKERCAAIMSQTRLMAERMDETCLSKEMRKHILWYLKGLKFASKLKNRASAIKSVRDIEDLTFDIMENCI